MKKLFLRLSILLSITVNAQLPKFEVISWEMQPVIKQGDKGTEDIRCGFEGGMVVKENGMYHMFPTERIGIYCTEKTRIGYWTSKDGKKWTRISTIFESSGDTTGEDRKAVYFAAMPVYDEKEQVWELFYVSYRYRLHNQHGYTHSDGHIRRAVSNVKGKAGIGGPYKEIGIIMEPDAESQSWEGDQGVDSFYPYFANGKWYGFYGSAITDSLPKKPCRNWAVGLAESPSLGGPWKRLPKGNPTKIFYRKDSMCLIENPIVYQFKDGSFYAIFDNLAGVTESDFDKRIPNIISTKENGSSAYMVSKNGVDWQFGSFLELKPYDKNWWNDMRTPLGLIEEGDGTFTLFFTAYKHYRGFAPIGMAKIRRK